MTNTPVIPQNSAPPVPQPLSPPPPQDALQQYRIEQLEKVLEKLQTKQDALEGTTTQRLDDSLSKQANMYSSYVSYITIEIGLLSLFVAAIGLWGIRNLKKAAHKKLDEWVKDKSSEYEKKFDDLYAQLNEQSAKQIEQGKEIEALKAFEEGNRAFDKGDYEEAIRHFDRSIKIFPTGQAYLYRGGAKGDFGNQKDALADFNEALALEPDNGVIYGSRAMAQTKQGNYRESILDSDQAIALGLIGAGNYIKACAYVLWDKPKPALEALEKAIAADTKFREQAKTDKDFTALRDDARFKKLVGQE